MKKKAIAVLLCVLALTVLGGFTAVSYTHLCSSSWIARLTAGCAR